MAPTKFGHAGEGISASSPGAERQARRDLDRMHAADGGEEALGPERAAARRGAVDAGHVGGDRFAQRRGFRPGGCKRFRRGRATPSPPRPTKSRRRQVALADPERNEPLPAAAVVEHFDDAARGGVARGGLDLGKPVAVGQVGDGHGPVHEEAGAGPQEGSTASSPSARSSRIGHSGRSSPQQAPTRLSKRLGHRLHFRDARLEVGHMALGDAPHLAARPRAVAPQREQRRDLSRGEAEPPRPLDEAKLVHVALAIVAVRVGAPLGGTQQADRFVVADHLGGHAARRSRRADVHATIVRLTFL